VGRCILQARFSLYVLYLGRATSGRNQPRMLASRGRGRSALAHLATHAAGSRAWVGADLVGLPPGRAAMGGVAYRWRETAALYAARTRHSDILPPSRCDIGRHAGCGLIPAIRACHERSAGSDFPEPAPGG